MTARKDGHQHAWELGESGETHKIRVQRVNALQFPVVLVNAQADARSM